MADSPDNLLWRILIPDKLGIDLVTNREKQLLSNPSDTGKEFKHR